MFVVLPFCQRDKWLTVKHLFWAVQLDKKSDLACVISHDSDTDAADVHDLAKEYFASVTEIVYDPWPGQQDWPYPQNWAWQSTCKLLRQKATKDESLQDGWLWMEPDCVPLRKRWLKDIAEAYERNGKPFMGFVHEVTAGHPHMNGAGCYPWNVADYTQTALLVRSQPWDVAARDEIMPHAAKANDLIQHLWGDDQRRALTFPDWRSVEDYVDLNAALFHRSKDGSLCDRLREGKPTKKAEEAKTPKSARAVWISGSTVKKEIKRNGETPTPVEFKGRRGQLIHVVERHVQTDPEELRRTTNAFDSWMRLYQTGRVTPFHMWEPPRTSAEIGDGRNLPYLKDLLAEGLTLAHRDDWVLLTNDDTILHPKLVDLIHDLPAGVEAVSSFRIEFDKHSAVTPDMSPARLAKLYNLDLGRDLFAFSAVWLQEHWFEIPDFFLGEMEWDLILTLLIREKLGIKTDLGNILEAIPYTELPLGYVLHEKHSRKWIKVHHDTPAKAHNRRLAKNWCQSRGYEYPIQAPRRRPDERHSTQPIR